MNAPRTVLARNASAMTLDGTRTFIVGHQDVAVIDPGPELPDHLDAICHALHGAGSVAVVLTHRHPDHAAGAPALARMLASVTTVKYGPAVPSEGDVITTDAGPLIALATPGHTPDHVVLHWPEESAIFCGDLLMGGTDTALVAAPEGNLTDYLESLDRLASFAPAVMYPTHGPHFTDAAAALDRYQVHRAARLRQVRAALDAGKRRVPEIAEFVYGAAIDAQLKPWVVATTLAYLDHLVAAGLAEGGDWHDE